MRCQRLAYLRLLQKQLTVETVSWQMGSGHNKQAVGGVFHPYHGHGFLFIDQIATPAWTRKGTTSV